MSISSAGGSNALSIYGAPFINAGSGLLPTATPPLFYSLIYAPGFSAHAYVDLFTFAPINELTNTYTNNLTASDECDTNVASSGTATFGKSGLSLSTAAANSGEAGMRIHSWTDVSEVALYDVTKGITAQWDATGIAAAGDAELFFGVVDQAAYTMNTNVTTNEGFWIYWKLVSGVETTYFCTSDGTLVTARDITGAGGPVISSSRRGTFKITSSGISYHRSGGDTPLATNTTNLPSGVMTNNYRFIAVIKNGASDTVTRTIKFNNISQYVG